MRLKFSHNKLCRILFFFGSHNLGVRCNKCITVAGKDGSDYGTGGGSHSGSGSKTGEW